MYFVLCATTSRPDIVQMHTQKCKRRCANSRCKIIWRIFGALRGNMKSNAASTKPACKSERFVPQLLESVHVLLHLDSIPFFFTLWVSHSPPIQSVDLAMPSTPTNSAVHWLMYQIFSSFVSYPCRKGRPSSWPRNMSELSKRSESGWRLCIRNTNSWKPWTRWESLRISASQMICKWQTCTARVHPPRRVAFVACLFLH